jgi:hypothetical protein
MCELKSEYGKVSRIFVLTRDTDRYDTNIVLMDPLRLSIIEYLSDLPDDYELMYLSLNSRETVIFQEHQFKEAYAKVYMQILKEQKIDIRRELRIASIMSTDEEAKDYLRDYNSQLRKHYDNLQTYYNNPVRLPGQKGPLRKPKTFRPVPTYWDFYDD